MVGNNPISDVSNGNQLWSVHAFLAASVNRGLIDTAREVGEVARPIIEEINDLTRGCNVS